MSIDKIKIHHILLLALGLRLAFGTGFVLGDDPAYGDLATQIIGGRYPALCDICVFSFRHVLLSCIALSLSLGGHSEFMYTLPILLSSIVCVYLIFALGSMLFDRTTGLLAAFFLAVFPLELVHATTLTNDIMLSMLLAASMLMFLKGIELKDRKPGLILFPLAGATLGIAIGVKINSLPVVVLFLLIALYKERQGIRFNAGPALFLTAWLMVQAIFCVGYYIKTGDFLAHIHAELNFNNRFNPSGFKETIPNLIATLLFYPRMMLCLTTEGHQGYTFYPYGFFYPVFVAALTYFLLKREKKIVIPLLWLIFLFAMMEFTPLKLFPFYHPIHRLIRFISIISIPSLLITAYFLRRLFKDNNLLLGSISVLIIIGLALTSIHQSYRKSYFYNDCVQDVRTANLLISYMDYVEIATDQEMRNALLFFGAYKNRGTVKSFENDHPRFPENSLVILGGARRPDMALDYSESFVEAIVPRSNWVKIFEVKGKPEIWRSTNLVIYKVVGEEDYDAGAP